MDTLTAMPDTFRAGTTLRYRRTLGDYPASAGWALTVFLAGAGVSSAIGVANGDDFDVEIPASETALLPPGVYGWTEIVEQGDDKHDPASGVVTVLPNLATATPGSLQSWEERELAALDQAILDLTTSGITSYQIGTRAATKNDLGLLYRLRGSVKAAVEAQRTGSATRPVLFSFTGTSQES